MLQVLGISKMKTFQGGVIKLLNPHLRRTEGIPIVDPPMVSAQEAPHMRDDDDVLGLEIEGDARAYPWWIMDNHHVANDIVGGHAVFIMFCEVCATGIAFDPVVHERRLIFRLGPIYNGTPAAIDDQTESVWSPYLAMAIDGKLRGERLQIMPLQQMQWGEWRRRHPQTRVLPEGLGHRGGHGSDDTIHSERIPEGFRETMQNLDERLPRSTVVLGVLGNGWQRVYPVEALRDLGGVMNDGPPEQPIVCVADPAPTSYSAAAFSRTYEGRVLTFEADKAGRGAMTDRETGSVWDLRGTAFAGPLAGASLQFVSSHVSKFFIWAAHFPNIDIAGIIHVPETQVIDRRA
jgi:hypothetical protein